MKKTIIGIVCGCLIITGSTFALGKENSIITNQQSIEVFEDRAKSLIEDMGIEGLQIRKVKSGNERLFIEATLVSNEHSANSITDKLVDILSKEIESSFEIHLEEPTETTIIFYENS